MLGGDQLEQSVTNLGFRLLAACSPSTENVPENVCLSPWGLHQQLSFLAGTASPQNRGKFLELLGEPTTAEQQPDDGETLMKAWHDLVGQKMTDKGLQLSTGLFTNASFYILVFPELEKFIRLSRAHGDELGTIHKGKSVLLDNWISEITKNNVNHIELDENVRSVFLTVIFFHADWHSTWLIKENETFYPTKDTSVTVDMLEDEEFVGDFVEDTKNGTKFLKLTYKNSQCTLLLILNDNTQKLEKLMVESPNYVSHWSDRLKKQTVDVLFPKFDLSCTYEILPILKKISPNFDCGCLGSELLGLYVNDLKQINGFKVDEHGTTAYSVTSTCVFDCATPPKRKIAQFHARVPFLFTLNHDKSLLFLGKVCQPTSS